MLQQIIGFFRAHTTAGIVASIHKMVARLEAHAAKSAASAEFHAELATAHAVEHEAAKQVRGKLADIVGLV